jgi:PAS domain S-box-containing protein
LLVRNDESLARIIEVLDALDCGVMLLDGGGRISYANERLCELLGRPYAELLGIEFRSIYATVEQAAEVDAVMRTLSAGVQHDFFVVQRGNVRRAVQICGHPIECETSAGLSTYTVVTVTDTARHKQVEHEALEQIEEITHLSDSVIQQARTLEDYSKTLEDRVQQSSQELDSANMDAIYMLAVANEAKDVDTGAHVRRIQGFSEAVAEELGLAESECRRIGYSALLHDVGKMQVADQILKKPGLLTQEERSEIQLHTLAGERILAKSPFFELARQIARSHHENWDGSGYPDRLAGENIPLAARIVRVVDVYDGLTSARSYKSAWPEQEALAEMQLYRGSHFDPVVFDAFLRAYAAGAIARVRRASELPYLKPGGGPPASGTPSVD